MLKSLNENGLSVWACTQCDYVAKQKVNLGNHIEAKHIQSNGYNCYHCGKLYPSKNALSSHVSRYHRNKDV